VTLVSVVIPTYNRRNYLKQAVDSVRSQTYNDIEIIIVDDNSSDGTERYLKSLDARNVKLIFHDSNKGQSATRNDGIEEAEGKYIFFLDDDDILLEKAIETMFDTIESLSKECAGVFASEKRFGQEEHIHNITGGKIKNNFDVDFGTSCSMFKSKIFDEIGHFDEDLSSSPDTDLVIRLFSEGYNIYGIEEALYKRRIHNGQVSRHLKEKVEVWSKILDKHANNISVEEKIEWNKTISWSHNKLGQYKPASERIENATQLLARNVSQVNRKDASYLFDAIFQQCQKLGRQDLIRSSLTELKQVLDTNQEELHEIDELYAKLAFGFIDVRETNKSRECLSKSIISDPVKLYKYYFYVLTFAGKRGYIFGRKLENRIKCSL
jgi:glycosyltransferase involved in cell wall biosynthesis